MSQKSPRYVIYDMSWFLLNHIIKGVPALEPRYKENRISEILEFAQTPFSFSLHNKLNMMVTHSPKHKLPHLMFLKLKLQRVKPRKRNCNFSKLL